VTDRQVMMFNMVISFRLSEDEIKFFRGYKLYPPYYYGDPDVDRANK